MTVIFNLLSRLFLEGRSWDQIQISGIRSFCRDFSLKIACISRMRKKWETKKPPTQSDLRFANLLKPSRQSQYNKLLCASSRRSKYRLSFVSRDSSKRFYTIPNYFMCLKLHFYTYLHFCQTAPNFAAATQIEIFSFAGLQPSDDPEKVRATACSRNNWNVHRLSKRKFLCNHMIHLSSLQTRASMAR